MARRKDETAEEWRIRHREDERLRREDPEYAAKIAAYKQRDDVKARHAAQERERRKTKQVKAYAREYRRNYTAEQKERQKERQAAWYQANKERTKEANNAWGKAHREKTREYLKAWEKRHPLRHMFQKSKSSAKARGLEHTITMNDIAWVTHCPIFGIELCYERDKKTLHRGNYPTLDRWDNAVGYVPGNVFVISWLANRMKWHATVEQLEAILRYMKEKPSVVGVQTVPC